MSWFVKKRQQKIAVEERTVRVPEGLWIKCEACKELIYRAELQNTHNVCPKCGYHFRIGVEERLTSLMAEGYVTLFSDLQSTDPLHFVAMKAYKDQLKKLIGKDIVALELRCAALEAELAELRDRLNQERGQRGLRAVPSPSAPGALIA